MALVLPPPLLGLSPGDLVPGDGAGHARFRKRAEDLVEAGLRGIVLREPLLGDAELLPLARELAALLAKVEGGWLCVHDSLHIARAANAQGAHIGFRSLAGPQARDVIGADIALGVSTHDGDSPEKWKHADYVFRSPVFQTASKDGLLEPIGLRGLNDFCTVLDGAKGPLVFALGGIGPLNCAELLGASRPPGLFGIAVRGALFVDEDARENLAVFLSSTERNPDNLEG